MAYGQNLDIADIPENNKVSIQSVENPNETLQVSLDPKLSVIKNAEKYYAKAKYNRSIKVDQIAKQQLLEGQINEYQNANEELLIIQTNQALKAWEKRYKGLIAKSRSDITTQHLETPFRVLDTTNYQVWIGKNAQSNDELLRKSHKEDIWMHARGVPGSHVIIRMSNNKDWPPKPFVEAVASVAAYYSKLKGSALVPVILTKRKFVRKPKNAAPGMVKVDKEDTILVKPEKQLINYE
jgi:predicted ribosome quality control (RQC) complex YloA/Tae2 family protein